MLGIILRILPILGIIFLILLILAAVSLLLALFFPVSYHIFCSRQADGLKAVVKVRWLFGMLRARYQYPDPGRIVAKGLCFTLYDSEFPAPKGEDAKQESKKTRGIRKRTDVKQTEDDGEEKAKTAAAGEGGGTGGPDATDEGKADLRECDDTGKGEQADSGNGSGADDGRTYSENYDSSSGNVQMEPESSVGKFFQKIEKIKYTIRSICDKIKEIWENISYYIELLQEESTKELFADVSLSVGKLLRCIRPRRIRAEILFGTGSPDTTGYVYGLYCMLAAFVRQGKVCVTPDFENAVFRGEMEISGHVTLWVLLVNGVKLALDKRLKRFVRKLRKTNAGGKDSKKDSV